MLTWWGELMVVVIAFIGGYVVCFFILRNNPKYLNVDKLLKEEMQKKGMRSLRPSRTR